MEKAALAAAKSVEETGIRRNLLEDLALKILYQMGEMSLYELARHMGLAVGIAEELFQRLRKEQLFQVTGINGGLHRFTTTSSGKTRALELLAHNQYVGPAPVSLEDYISRTHAQSVAGIRVLPSDISRAFVDLVLDIRILNQLGTAIASGRSLFLYGPSGTGKTTIAETLMRLFENDPVWLPYAVEVDGQIITVYDAVAHKRLDQAPAIEQDGRWLLCQRPKLMIGGELTVEMLDLQYNPSAKFFNAPVQMKANNGLLVVDDFGRQRLSPEELLNRWVVPMDRRIDFLSLAGGKKIQIPFDVLLVFATNLDPSKTMDAAFLRRIQTKIKVDFVTPEQFREIFRRTCAQHRLEYDEAVTDDLIRIISSEYSEPLRACYPRDIVQQILWKAKYLQKEPQVDRVALTQACQNYFLSI